MNILVINAGSSSVKFTLMELPAKKEMAKGQIERIGTSKARLTFQDSSAERIEKQVTVADTAAAVACIKTCLQNSRRGATGEVAEPAAIGHRVVHGGESITAPVVVDHAVKQVIRDCFSLAPLHNPPNLAGIEACESQFPGLPQVAVFDTAFHATLPERAFLYGLPYQYYREHKIRRYGFHGTSHQYVSQTAARFLDRPLATLKMVTCHIGNGCSVTAIAGGHSVDTSMGFTPLEGLVMGTRCGDLDPAVVFYLMEQGGLDAAGINNLLNRQSGLLGLAEIESSDFRDVLVAAEAGNQRAAVALEVFGYRLRKYIGAYAAVLGGLDVLVFTGGIGENAPRFREMVCDGLDSAQGLGIILDATGNAAATGEIRGIHADQSRVSVLVVPTDEELAIARQTYNVLENGKQQA